MIDVVKRVNDFFRRELWELDTSTLSSFRSIVIKTLRLINVALRQFTEGQLTLRAMSLVYTTLLSIVPLLAISFSILKAFGVHNDVVEPFLLKFLAPMGAKGKEITGTIIGFVENMKAGVLGSLGLALLLYTVTTVIQKIEKSFNSIWRIRKTRSFARRFSDYISVLIIGPVMIFTAMGLTASFRSNMIVMKVLAIEPFGTMFFYGAKLIPYLIVCSAFTFLYIFLPNTKVKFSSALVGGLIAGIMWEVAGWGFASFVVKSTKYAAIYSGFAILIMFMIWLYVSWLILLVGAQLSFYHQYPHFLMAKQNVFSMSNRLRERLALLIMYVIGHSHYYDERPSTLDMLVERLGTPVDPVYDIIILLEKNGLLLETGDDPPAYLPKKDIETISLHELLDAVRIAGPQALFVERKVLHVPAVDAVLNEVSDSLSDTLKNRSLKDMVTAGE